MTLMFMLLACAKEPWVEGRAKLEADGIHVSAALHDIDEVTVAGKTLREGESVVLPRSMAKPGENSIPIEGEGLNPKMSTAFFMTTVRELISPTCDGEGTGLVAGDGSKGFAATKCPLLDGNIVVDVQVPEGVSLHIDGGAQQGDKLLVDLGPALMRQARPTTPQTQINVREDRQLWLEYPDGTRWEETVKVQVVGDALGPWVEAAPASIQRLGGSGGAPYHSALYYAGGAWSVEGPAEHLGDVDLIIKVVERAPPKPLKTCTYQRYNNTVGFQVKAVAVDQTYAAFNRAGEEVGRVTLSPKGCPAFVELAPGQDTLTAIPGQTAVSDWVKRLLK